MAVTMLPVSWKPLKASCAGDDWVLSLLNDERQGTSRIRKDSLRSLGPFIADTKEA